MKKLIKISSDCSGVGAFPQALKRLGVNYEEQFACDFDFYARQTYLLNFGTKEDVDLGNTKEHKYYADLVKSFSLGKKVSDKEQELLSEANEFAKKFSFYYPFSMYQREIPRDSSNIYIGSFPCQSFSLAGKRLGQEDRRGVLFYNGHEFISKNKPRYFIIENVKGLLSDDSGKTFQRWIDFLGGKSVNGNPVIFPVDEAVPYHVYYQVLNAKNYGIPQNRERIFIIGIRDDVDNDFSFPKPFPLVKRLKDVLESEVDEKYFLSDKMVGYLQTRKDNFNNGKINYKDENDVATTITKSSGSIDVSDNIIKVGFINQDTQASQVISENGIMPNVCAGTHGYALGYVETESEMKILGYTRDTKGKVTSRHEQELSNTIHTATGGGGNTDQFVLINSEAKIGAIRGRNPSNPLSRVSGLPTEQMLEINENGTSNALTTVQKDNVVVYPKSEYKGIAVHPLSKKLEFTGFKDGNCPTLLATDYKAPKCVLYDFTNDFGEAQPREYTETSPSLRSSRSGLAVNSNQEIKTKKLTDKQLDKLENLVVDENIAGCITEAIGRAGSSDEYMSSVKRNAIITQRIRRLIPLETFRLMDFNFGIPNVPDFKWEVSDSQAYRQAGNSIVVNVLCEIIKKLKL